MFVATLVANGGLNHSLLSEVAHQFDMDFGRAGVVTGTQMIGDGFAGDIYFRPSAEFSYDQAGPFADAISSRAEVISAVAERNEIPVDVVVLPLELRTKSVPLLIADMDSTMITCECIDELADYAGIKPEIAAITERAMAGELDFVGALTERVALLAGLDEGVIEQCLAERVRATPGAETLVRTMRAQGTRTVLVSGGFTRFAEPVGAMIGFDRVVANVLEIEGGVLTGRVLPPIVDSGAKLATLQAECAVLGVPLSSALAIGDGANDVPMLEAAGLGVAYHGHAAAVAAADAAIRHGDLTVLLYAMGVPRADWVVN